MGGVTHAKDVVFKALKKGKHVVTANKALLAQLLPEVSAGSVTNVKPRSPFPSPLLCGDFCFCCQIFVSAD